MTFFRYVGQVLRYGISASLALALVISLVMLFVGGTTAKVGFDLEFGAFDGIWFLLGLPLITIAALTILSPLSFGIYRLLFQRRVQAAEDGV
jgi:membrane-bound metal-dependent hydrolase YbcI (DUF457 family)